MAGAILQGNSRRTAVAAVAERPTRGGILLVDFALSTQAFAKVRVRMNTMVFVDYLVFHRVEDDWMITSKAYHVDRVIAAEAASA